MSARSSFLRTPGTRLGLRPADGGAAHGSIDDTARPLRRPEPTLDRLNETLGPLRERADRDAAARGIQGYARGRSAPRDALPRPELPSRDPPSRSTHRSPTPISTLLCRRFIRDYRDFYGYDAAVRSRRDRSASSSAAIGAPSRPRGTLSTDAARRADRVRSRRVLRAHAASADDRRRPARRRSRPGEARPGPLVGRGALVDHRSSPRAPVSACTTAAVC